MQDDCWWCHKTLRLAETVYADNAQVFPVHALCKGAAIQYLLWREILRPAFNGPAERDNG